MFLRFGSWIGGDRDGNPHVTARVTEDTLREHKATALRLYQAAMDRMRGLLSSAEALGISDALRASLEEDRALFPDDMRRAVERYPRQPYRQKMAIVYRKLGATLQETARPWRADYRPGPGVYPSAAAFIHDLDLVQQSLRAHRGERLASGRLGVLREQAESFGFHLASLDLRQHAERHTAALAEVFARYGLGADYAAWPEERKAELLVARAALAASPHPGRARLLGGDERDPGHLPGGPAGPRPPGTGRRVHLHRLHDPRAERHPGPPAAGHGRRLRRRSRRGAALRDREGPARGDGGDGGPLREPRLRGAPGASGAAGSR